MAGRGREAGFWLFMLLLSAIVIVVTGSAGQASLAASIKPVAPSGSKYTPRSWARALLRSTGLPDTSCNMGFVTAWENAEGGNWHNAAAFNPLNTTQTEPGSSPINSVKVQAYTSWQEGFSATEATLGNGNYGGILAAMKAGNNAQSAANAVAASPWGTAPFTASCS